MELGCRREPVDAGQIDVDHRDVGLGLECGRDDRVAAVDGGYDVQIRLQLEQRDERALDHVDILGEEDPDGQHLYPR